MYVLQVATAKAGFCVHAIYGTFSLRGLRIFFAFGRVHFDGSFDGVCFGVDGVCKEARR